VYSLVLQPRPTPTPRTTWYEIIAKILFYTLVFIIIPLVLAWILYTRFDDLADAALHAAKNAYRNFFVSPLREFYRHAPSLLGGWEGQPLPRICSKITYHVYGDEGFWRRNAEECQVLYRAKEEAWLRIAQPVAGAVILFCIVVVVRFLLVEIFRPPPPPKRDPAVVAQEREMFETYRAMQTLVRQLSRAWTPNQQQQQQQQNFGINNQQERRNYNGQPPFRRR